MRLRLIQILLFLIAVGGVFAALSGRREPDFEALRTKGRNLSRGEATSYEERLKVDPDDLELRYQLAWYYSDHLHRPDGSRWAEPQEHQLWIVRKHPEALLAGQFMGLWDDLEGLAAIQEIWQQNIQCHAENPDVLGNAAGFLQLWTRQSDQADALLLKAHRLDPTNPEWSEALGHMYNNKCSPPDAEIPSPELRAEFAAKALAAFEKALRYSDRSPRYDELLNHVIRSALRTRDFDKAERYAREMVDSSVEDTAATRQSIEGALFFGNLVIAHAALESGDIESAEAHLLRLPPTAHRRQLVMPGPMNLVEKLLKLGRTEAVIEYLRRCQAVRRACGPHEVVPIPDPLHATIDQWISQIESGGMPKLHTGRWY